MFFTFLNIYTFKKLKNRFVTYIFPVKLHDLSMNHLDFLICVLYYKHF